VCAEIASLLPVAVGAAAAARYDFAEWLSSRVMMQLSNEAGQSQVTVGLGWRADAEALRLPAVWPTLLHRTGGTSATLFVWLSNVSPDQQKHQHKRSPVTMAFKAARRICRMRAPQTRTPREFCTRAIAAKQRATAACL